MKIDEIQKITPRVITNDVLESKSQLPTSIYVYICRLRTQIYTRDVRLES